MSETQEVIKPAQDEKGRFVTGNIGGGRSKGSRNKLGEDFIRDMYLAWEAQGPQVIDRVIEDRPQDFLKVVASLLPKEFNLNANVFADISSDDLRSMLAAIESFESHALQGGHPGGVEAADGHEQDRLLLPGRRAAA